MFDIKIYSKKDYRFYAWFVRTRKESDFAVGGDVLIKEVKQAMRKWANTPIPEIYIVHSSDSGEYCIRRYPLPEYLTSLNDAKEYFEEYEYLRYIPSAYDCTGQIFTSWFKVYKYHGRFWVYHATSMDV